MRCPKTRILAAMGLVTLLAGCGQLFSWKSSGIPDALNTENLIRTAGTPLGIKLSLGGQERARREDTLLTERHFHATLTSGTRVQLLTAYAAEVKRAIERRGGSLNGSGTGGTTGALSNFYEFSYEYSWHGNSGIVRVYAFDGSDGAVEVISLCYEHHR